jgi:hypothetical protein
MNQKFQEQPIVPQYADSFIIQWFYRLIHLTYKT